MVADFGAREERSAGWKPALQISAEAAAVGERDEWLDDASSCGWLAKRARYIVPLHMRTERSAGWKPALQIGAGAATVGGRARRVARWVQVHVVCSRRGHDVSCPYMCGRRI